MAIVKYLGECLARDGMTPVRFFKNADKNFDDVLCPEEIKDYAKVLLADDFQGVNYQKLVKAFDVNNNGVIELEEFTGLMDLAMKSSADTQGFKKISGAFSGDTNKFSKTVMNQAKNLWVGAAKGYKRKQTINKNSKNSITLPQKILPEDRLTHEDVIARLKDLIKVESKIGEPYDDIREIFIKINTWKKKQGNSEEIESFLKNTLKQKKDLFVHNAKTAEELLRRLQKDIGLTDDEITVIIYTSMNPEFFNHLILL